MLSCQNADRSDIQEASSDAPASSLGFAFGRAAHQKEEEKAAEQSTDPATGEITGKALQAIIVFACSRRNVIERGCAETRKADGPIVDRASDRPAPSRSQDAAETPTANGNVEVPLLKLPAVCLPS